MYKCMPRIAYHTIFCVNIDLIIYAYIQRDLMMGFTNLRCNQQNHVG